MVSGLREAKHNVQDENDIPVERGRSLEGVCCRRLPAETLRERGVPRRT